MESSYSLLSVLGVNKEAGVVRACAVADEADRDIEDRGEDLGLRARGPAHVVADESDEAQVLLDLDTGNLAEISKQGLAQDALSVRLGAGVVEGYRNALL